MRYRFQDDKELRHLCALLVDSGIPARIVDGSDPSHIRTGNHSVYMHGSLYQIKLNRSIAVVRNSPEAVVRWVALAPPRDASTV
jgi:hypothetical protein